VRHYVVLEGPYLLVVALGHGVLSPREGGYLLRHRPAFGLPLNASAVHHLDVVVAEEPEDPEGVGGPPVVLVPVKDNRRIWGDALLLHELGKMLRVEIVAVDRIVQILDPVDLDSVGDVPYIVQKNVLVALDDAVVLGIVQVLCDPVGRNQCLRMYVALLFYLLRHLNSPLLQCQLHRRIF
jgi:hypothetical protein